MPAEGLARQRQNLDTIVATGVEFDVRARVAEWRFSLSYAFTDSEVEADGAAMALNGLRPVQVARHNGAVTAAYICNMSGEASITVRYIGGRFEDDLNQRPLDDALTVGARVLVPLYGPLKIEFRAENIFDARVETAVSGTGRIERAMPQTFWTGLRFAFF